ncbi:glycoside hydrolase, family 76 [Sporothrix brasiliensis 5110]|uniref:Glycoside hydrolase, family 76 n=1 Tax=Sporothrix brasiliensis 5110 TaxID=1398154 RepID=A0A0C2INM6_9PEZI|nr:glycoside hydrolase, family 76 [Sporothrix brasiliensis 5110]KIH88585.1 glycoside hydrolase, family 76 [Sporothrix brasiliensis 5110]
MITRLAHLACTALAASTATAAIVGPGGGIEIDTDSDSASFSPSPNPFLPQHILTKTRLPAVELAKFNVVDEFLEALQVMQDDYFEPWLGQWPKAIDWTAAVIGTHVAGALSSLSRGLTAESGLKEKENLIMTYFSQLLSYYFGQDAFAIRNEAYDDMLWVVLGWLEALQFIDLHTSLYHQTAADSNTAASDIIGLRNQSWYGNLWTPAFAHRARIFWDIASQGWDDKLCGGGMTWNPRLEPYKNAITNELFIAASASMYLYFPGDANDSPFLNANDPRASDPLASSANATGHSNSPHEAKHLKFALDGYKWLAHSGMKNKQGLYVDGFHISGWKNISNPNTRCDQRNDMVYTYNQGVLLTGHIGIWKVTGDERHLWEGHVLIQNVINATGYDLVRDGPIDDIADLEPGQLSPWRGLGRAGVLEDQCDVGGHCSQNSQTFKSIFFHHLTAFCAPLDTAYVGTHPDGSTQQSPLARQLYERTLNDHTKACAVYLGWIRHNVNAALATKDADGKFGMWWTAGLLKINSTSLEALGDTSPEGPGVDYRTYGVPNDDLWVSTPVDSELPTAPILDEPSYRGGGQAPLTGGRAKSGKRTGHASGDDRDNSVNAPPTLAGHPTDPNTRGRGRTVETQAGGLAVLRCFWEISQRASHIDL